MADYKDYIVRYDIVADVTKAAEGLQSIANIAKQFEGPMNSLKTAITQVSQSVYQLKQNSQMTFAPKIDVGAFNNQLRSMVTQVRSAAAEMHTAIFEALSGNAAATKTAQKGIGSALGGNRSVAAIKKDIEAYNKELDKLLGTPKKNKKGNTIRNRDGSILMTKNALAKGSAQVQQQMQERLLKLESQKRMFQNLIQQRKAELAVAEKLEKETAAQQAKVAKAQSSAPASTSSRSTAAQPAKLTNVTPAVIREWKKAFGDAKSKALTVNIRGNATGAGGALTVIEQIQASLKALQAQGTFNINPILNTEAFAATEAQLTRLASLSAAVVSPFTSKDDKTKTGKGSSLVSTLTKDEKTKLTNAQKQIKAWNEKIAPIQSRLDANKAIPEDQRTPAIKGQITRDTKTLANYQAGKAEQENIVKSLQGKAGAAVKATATSVKPLSLDIVGNLSKINVTAKAPVVSVVGEITKLQGKVSEAIPVNVKIMADQVQASLRSIPAPTLDVKVHLITDQAKQQLQNLAVQSKPVAKPVKGTTTPSTTSQTTTNVAGTSVTPTPKESKVGTPQGKKTTTKASIAGSIDTKDIINQIKVIPRQTIPIAVKLMWERGVIGRQEQIKKLAGNIPPVTLSFDTSVALAKLEDFIAKVRAASPQNIKLTASGIASKTTPAPATTKSPKTSNPVTASVPSKSKTPVVSGTKKSEVVDPIKNLAQTKLPPITLQLDTTAATAALEGFIAKVKAASPQNIKLTASGSQGATGGTTQKSSKQSGTTGHQPLTPRQYRDNIGKHLSKGFQLPKNYSSMIAYQERVRGWHLDQMRRDAISAFAQETPYEKYLKSLAPTTTGKGAKKVVWGKNMPEETAPKGMHWVRNNNLSSFLNPAQQKELGFLQGQEDKAAQKVAGMRTQVAESSKRLQTRITSTEQQFQALQNKLAPLRQQMNQLEEMKKPFLSLKKLNKAQRQAVARIEQSQALINQQIEAAQAPLLAQMRYNDQLMSRYQSLARGQIATAVESHRQTQSAVGRYTEGWSLAPNQGQVSADHLNKASKLQTQFHNAMLPFAPNKGQMDMLMKHRRYFKQAIKTTGITPMPGMAAPQMLQYLQGVSSQMQQSSVAVPWQLQSQINKLQGDVAKSKGIGESTASRRSGVAPMPVHQKPFFDRSRKWAYPFTGQTSFGVRTPMAVDMAKGMGVMFAIGGAMSAIGSSFSQAMEYQNTMRTTQAILQNGTDTYSQNSFKNMEATVRNVGVKTKFSAPEVASAARFLAMAGYDIDAINAAIRPIADLALIGDSDLGETADKMTNIMTTFQIAPDRMREAANIMATTATRSNTDLMMLAESAKYGGGVANMYGRNDPNLFADTMALFGVMGNAGIQASSAGTALRMMYQNLFKPNKNQKAVLDMMKQSYGITTLKEDGSYRSMSDILIEMAQRIPENQMAQIVGNLFRITAQPGAAATLLAAAGGDKGVAEEIGTGIEAMSSKMSSKAGLSSLVSLMLANRNSTNGNISGAIAEEKQNTMSGLWAQVTSTFTEGIVQAFENRQGGFEEMLKKLRDYLAKPKTIQMMQNLLDMIIEIGKVMAGFVKIWASLYNAAPGLIKFWITFQMGITQMGALIAPIISLIGVFDRLKGSIMALAGISAAGGATVTRNVAGSVAAGTAANAAIANTPFIVGSGKFGTNKVIRGNIATRAHNAMAANAILAGELALSGASKQSTLAALNKETRQHYAAVRERAARIYGPARAGRAFRAAATAVPTMASFAPMFGGLKSMLMGLLTGLAKAAGFLLNPITLATGAVVGLGFGLYKLKQFADGNTEAQVLAQKQMAKLSSEAVQTMVDNYKWYQEQIDKYKNPAQTLESVGKSDKQIEYEEQAENFRSEYADIIKGDLSKNASEKGIRQQVEAFRKRVNQNNLYKYAFGDEYDKYVGSGLTEDNSSLKYTGTDADGGIALYNLLFAPKRHAKEVQNREIQAALRTAGVNRPEIQAAHEQIVRLRELYLGGQLTQEEYFSKAYAERDKVVDINNPNLRSSEGLTLEAFQNITNPSVYREYALGQYNVLNSFINGDDGTIVAKLNAQKNLRDRLIMSGEQYWQAISNVIGDYPIQFKAVSMDEKVVKDIELSLSMIPNTGRIDFNAVASQIQSTIGEFKKNLEDFANMTAKVYKAMADAGLVSNTEEDMNSFVWQQMEHAHITKEQAASYFHNYLPENSVWKKAGKTLEEYQDYIADPNGKVTINGKEYHSAASRVAIRKRLTKNAVNEMMGTVNKLKAPAPATTTTSITPSTTQTPGKPTSTKDQTAYASSYERSAARPTQVVFNINNLASFDRTTVASSAEERDLMAAMEERIASAVYTMFAEASNQAQRVMDLT